MAKTAIITTLTFIISASRSVASAQASCTSPVWKSVPGTSLNTSVQSSLQFDKDLETYCKPECLSRQDCVTFDSYLVAGRPSCYFSTFYTPDSTHWEYTRSCTSSGKTCRFLYIGEYTVLDSNAFTSVTSTSGEDCLQKCVDSRTCQVASYLGINCQHSTSEQAALAGRTLQTGWSQYLKRTCTTPTTTTTTTTTTTSVTTTTTTPGLCPHGGINLWASQSGVRVSSGKGHPSAQTLDQCRQLCIRNPVCKAISYQANAADVRCWTLSDVQLYIITPDAGFLYEMLHRCADPGQASCSEGQVIVWKTTIDRRGLHGVEEHLGTTLDACRNICLSTSGCSAIDYADNATGVKCWTFRTESTLQLVHSTGVIHENLEPCV